MFIELYAPAAKDVAGGVLVDEIGRAVRGVSNKGAFPGLVLKLVAVVRVNMNIAGASEDTKLGQIREFSGDSLHRDALAALVPCSGSDMYSSHEGLIPE